MKRPKVAVIDSGYDSFDYEKELFRQAGYQFEIFQGGHHDREGKKEFSKEAEGILVRWTEINNDFFQTATKVKAIVRYGVGYDNIDIDSASRHQVRVANVQGYANQAVSDHAIALIYACARALPRDLHSLRNNYTKPPINEIPEIHRLTLGIIGLGRIGSTLCKKATSLFDKIIASDPYIPEERFSKFGAISVSLADLLAQSDVISIHCNLTDETTNLIDLESINLMKKKPILINTARGPVVNETALLQGLEEGKIHAAGLDVFVDEPPLENTDQLLFHPQVVSTGHYAWYSKHSLLELQKRAADNLLSLLMGDIPEDCLNP
jgi:D-3-phosphoglycerate dehydrogenase